MERRFNWPVVWFFFFIIIFGYKLIVFIDDKIKGPFDYKNTYINSIKCYYKNNPELFNFNNGQEILNIEDISFGRFKCNGCSSYNNPPLDKNNNECAGYFIITRTADNEIIVDASHMCDLV